MEKVFSLDKNRRKSGGPDGLEAWCVALSACFINFVMAGLGRMSGILYVEFIDIFHVNRLQASVPFSARSLARNLFGPVVGILGQKYGVRTTTLIGGIIGTLGATICFYAQDILWITILWGVVNGAGAALSMTLPQVILSQHFEKYRTTASGMAFSGGCVGSFLFPVLLEYLLKTYGLGGSFLILSGIIMNVIPAAMILRKPSWLKKKSRKSTGVSAEKKNETCETNDEHYKSDENNKDNFVIKEESLVKKGNGRHNAIFTNEDFEKFKKINTKFLRENDHLVIKLLKANSSTKDDNGGDHDNAKLFAEFPESTIQVYLKDLYTLIDSNVQENGTIFEACMKDSTTTSGSNSDKKLIQKNCKNANSEILLSTSTLSYCTNFEFYNFLSSKLKNIINNDIQNLVLTDEEAVELNMIAEQLKYILIMLDFIENNSSLRLNQDTNTMLSEKVVDKHPNTFKAHIKTALMLHRNPLFLLISFSRSVHFLTFIPAITIIVDFSMDKGLLEEDGKYVIAAISFGDLMGRLCLGWVTDKDYLSLPRYMLIVMIMQGASTVALSFMTSKLTLLTTIAAFGLLQGSLFVRHPVLVSKYLESHEQSVAMGCFNFFSGLLGFALPNYIGYFRDTIGSYDYIFYINGAIGSSVGIMWFFEPYFIKLTSSPQEAV